MAQSKSATGIISNFLKNDPNPPKMAEIKEFKAACSMQEWNDFARQIDPTFEPPQGD